MSRSKNPLRYLGLGSSRKGAEHWWVQRLTSVLLAPLSIWFVVSIISILGSSEQEVREWLSSPFAAVPMSLFVIFGFHHLHHGLSEISEDYIHDRGALGAVLMMINVGCLAVGIVAIFSILHIVFSG